MMLFLNLFADVILVAFLGSIDALFFSVLIFALFFSFLVISLAYAHVFGGSWLRLTCGTFRAQRMLLASLSHLLLIGLPLLLVDQLVHRDDFGKVCATRRVLVLEVRRRRCPLRLINGLLLNILLAHGRLGCLLRLCKSSFRCNERTIILLLVNKSIVRPMAVPTLMAWLLLNVSCLRLGLFWRVAVISATFCNKSKSNVSQLIWKTRKEF